jgi:mono/diheme cytochrome c family protein
LIEDEAAGGIPSMNIRIRAAALALSAALAAAVASQALAQVTSDSESLSGSNKTAPGIAQKPGGGPTTRPEPVSGQQVYQQICQACHMADGKGGAGAGVIPALAANPKLNVAAYPITVVVRGKGGMPPFSTILDPAQVAAVVGYVRTHFGNAYAKPVTAEEVSRLWVEPSANDH